MASSAHDNAVDELVPLFESIGLTSQKASETARNKKLAAALKDVIVASGILAEGQENECAEAENRKALGTLLYTLASTGVPAKDARPDNVAYIAKAVGDGKLTTTNQVAAAIKFFQKRPESEAIVDDAKFNKECGVGVTVSPAEVALHVSQVVEKQKDQLISKRYQVVNKLLATLSQLPDLRWANGQIVKKEFDAAILGLLGPKDERDIPKKKKEKANAAEQTHGPEAPAAPRDAFAHLKEGEMLKLHKPGGNPQNKESLMKEHLEKTGGKVRTRFPPEPNGFLHIGHAKAINVNFGYAKIHGGTCYLRYDDTNPEAEEQVYLDSILETVRWLGFEPDLITYSSDHFQRLYDFAMELIRRDKAYVCHCTAEEIFEQRGGVNKGPRYACKHRTRPIEESVKEFERMRKGEYKEGEAILRMKMDLENPNPQFWDLVAYRVLNAHHHRTGDKWIIYPTYDYTHCLCDSFEHITHSMCTLEFRLSRESYYWLCDALEVYKPVQWEYGRLNITRTVLSKRKILQLVEEKIVRGWDDPRLYTLPALRRRGVPPEAINNFVREVGVTTATTITDVARLDNHIRDVLNERAPRIMAILEPVSVVLENLPASHLETIELPNKPRDPDMGSHCVPFASRLYIDASDFRETSDDPNYFRLAPGKSVGLLCVPHPITLLRVEKDASDKVTHLVCRYENSGKHAKPKTYIQWVADASALCSPVQIDEVRLYNPLFTHANPQDKTAVPEGFLSDINPHSLEIVRTAIAEVGLAQWIRDHPCDRVNPESYRFQFIRVGYFCVDKETVWPDAGETNGGKVAKLLVVNQTIDLKEDPGKKPI